MNWEQLPTQEEPDSGRDLFFPLFRFASFAPLRDIVFSNFRFPTSRRLAQRGFLEESPATSPSHWAGSRT